MRQDSLIPPFGKQAYRCRPPGVYEHQTEHGRNDSEENTHQGLGGTLKEDSGCTGKTGQDRIVIGRGRTGQDAEEGEEEPEAMLSYLQCYLHYLQVGLHSAHRDFGSVLESSVCGVHSCQRQPG